MPSFPPPVITAVFEPATPADAEPLLAGLQELQADDPTLQVERDAESGLPLVLGMGELHLEIVAERLRERGGCEVRPSRPRAALRTGARQQGEGRASVQSSTSGRLQSAEAVVVVAPDAGADVAVDVAAVRSHPAAAAVARELASAAAGVRGGPLRGARLCV